MRSPGVRALITFGKKTGNSRSFYEPRTKFFMDPQEKEGFFPDQNTGFFHFDGIIPQRTIETPTDARYEVFLSDGEIN